MKKALITALAITLQISCATAAPALVRAWDIDTTGQPAPAQFSAYHGESVEFVARLLGANRRPVALDEGWTASLMVSTNGADYWGWNGASVSTGGVLRATWEPRMDCGADTYRCFIRAADPSDSNLIYRANFTLRLLASPGFRPAELEPPVRTLDFATVEVSNAPWLTVEADPAWSAWADANTNRLGYVSHVEEAETALTADYAEQAGSADEAQTAGTATYADSSAFATNAADAQHAWNAETASTLLVGFAARDGEFFTECDGAVAQAATNYTDSAITAATNALQDTALAGKLDNTGLHNNNGTLRAVSFNTDGLFIFNGEVWLDVPATSGAALTAGDLENPDSYLYQMFDEKASKSETATAVSNIVTKAYVENLGIESGIQEETDPTVPQWAKAQTKPTYTAGEVGATTPADVTAAIRDLSLGGIWDEQIQVWWTPRMRNGSLTYEATTNVNLNAED